MKKRIALLLLIVMIFTLTLPLLIGAAEGPTWILSKDRKTLTKGETVYTYYDSAEALGLEVFFKHKVVCEKEVDGFDLEINERCPDVVCLKGKLTYVFATESGRKRLNNFVDLKTVSYYSLMTSSSQFESNVPISFVEHIEDNGKKVVLSAANLGDCEYKIIWARDNLGCLSKRYGMLYSYNDECYFINCSDFDKAYFNEDGSLSTRTGVIYESRKLDNDMLNDLQSVISNMDNAVTTYEYVDYYSEIHEDNYSGLDKEIANALVVIGAIVVGFVFPIPFLVLGLALPRSKKLGRPKYWYILAIIAAAWMLLSLIISALLIILALL